MVWRYTHAIYRLIPGSNSTTVKSTNPPKPTDTNHAGEYGRGRSRIHSSSRYAFTYNPYDTPTLAR